MVYLDENTDSDYIKCVAEIQLEGDNKFELIPNTTLDRDVIYFSGPAGSGKSYQMASYLRNYKKKFKDNKIFLISEKEEDKTLDTIGDLKRIKIDNSMIEDPLDLKDFTEIGPCIVLFDDIDSWIKKFDV